MACMISRGYRTYVTVATYWNLAELNVLAASKGKQAQAQQAQSQVLLDLQTCATDAGAVGLTSLMLAPNALSQTHWAVRFTADPPERAVKFTVVELTWNGESFAVKTQRGELPRGAKQIGI